MTQWEPRDIKGRAPYGYFVDPEDSRRAIPDEPTIKLLNKALDQLDAGVTLREAADWLCSVAPKLSHVGLQQIWDRLRPDHPRKQPRPKKAKRTAAERTQQIIKQKIANDKRTLAAAKKRISKRQEVLGDAKRIDEAPFVETPLEFDVSEIAEDEHIVFKPNPGPQAKFLAASEQEVLYGGAAGGEPKSWFSASFCSNASK